VIFLRVPAVLAYRDLVTRAVETVCKIATARDGSRLPLGDEVVVEVVSAVGEAFNNAVLHAYQGTGRGEVSLEI
jgi:anti-sigma regulatory factor (Ser/Thr protein kinase)